MSLDADFLKALIEADDPLTVLWERMLALWHVEAYPGDVVAFYNERESRLNEFEQTLYHGYFEIYELLLQRALRQDGGYVRERLKGDSVVIIADSLSMREVALLRERLKGHGWQVDVEGFAVAPFPTLTESLCEKLLDVTAPSGKPSGVAMRRDGGNFRYCYVAGPSEVPNLPAGEPTLVWLRLPDKELEQVTVAQATTVADAINATVETLTRLLKQASGRSVFITSDHGYLYATSASHYWKMPEGVEEAASKIFARESRAQPLGKGGAKGLQHQEASGVEQCYFVFSQAHVGIRGRYWWASASQLDRCTGHGGLSAAEVFVPILSVQRVN